MRIYGLTGRMGSGKDTLADILIVHGFKKYVYSNVIKQELEKRELEPTRENFQNMGNVLRERHGNDFLSKKLYEKIMSDGVKKAIVVGIRNPGEAKFFQRMDNFKLVWVESDKNTRMKRLIDRGLEKDPSSKKEFEKMEKKENSTGIEKVKSMADVIIENNETVEKLKQKAREIFCI